MKVACFAGVLATATPMFSVAAADFPVGVANANPSIAQVADTAIASTIDQFGLIVAQTPRTTEAAESSLVSGSTLATACIARRVIQSDGPAFTFTALVPASDSAVLVSRPMEPGNKFAVIECGARVQSLAVYKAQVCELAKGNEAVQKRTKQVIGMSGIEMCAAATSLLP